MSAPYYAQLLAMGNELGTHSYTHPEDTNVLTPAQIQFEFEQSKLLLEQQMSAYLEHPFTIAGAAVPGMPESLLTSEQIIQYFDYITGGAVFVGSGYPGAFGFLTPDLTSSVYLAPNTSFDFTLVDFQHHTAAEAGAIWAQEWNALVANANTPIVVWPWHDYGPTQWDLDGVASPYTLQMFTDWIQRAYLAGDEFVTAVDLAGRIQSFAQSGVTSTVSGNVVTVTVTSAHAGDFALDVAGQGSQVIENVAGWYAYDSDSLFLPETGGNFAITLGAAADDVTHITALPMRGDLLSVTGDGLNLSFSMVGEGHVLIDLGRGQVHPLSPGRRSPAWWAINWISRLPGRANMMSQSSSWHPRLPSCQHCRLLGRYGIERHRFHHQHRRPDHFGHPERRACGGDVVKVSLDNGATWLTATAAAGDTTFSLAGVTLTASGTLVARVENVNGVASTAFVQAYVLDQVSPAAPASPDLVVASDSGVSSTDNITNAVNPTFTGTAEIGSTITLFDGTTQVGIGITTVNGDWFATTSTLVDGTHSITAKATDVAGNVSSPRQPCRSPSTAQPRGPVCPGSAGGVGQRHVQHGQHHQGDQADIHRHGRGRQHGDPVRRHDSDRHRHCHGRRAVDHHRLDPAARNP